MRFSQSGTLPAAIAVTAIAAYLYPLTLPTPLLDPDEGLHAAIAQEMVETGDYLVPRFLGKTFPDKPIFYFVAQAFSLRAFGMNSFAVRLPGVLFALFGVWTTWLCGKRLFDQHTGQLASLVSLTLLVPTAVAQAPIHDIALVPFTNLLLLNLWTLNETQSVRLRRRLIVFAGGAIALALLTKGLIGIAVVSVGYFLHAIWQRQLSFSLLFTYATILLLGACLAAPWFGYMEVSQSGYLRYYFYERHVLGYATATQTHGKEPCYYYFLPIVAGTMPWIAHASPAIAELLKGRQQTREHSAFRFVVCWLVGGLLFLSLAHSKLVTYTLPLYPAIALLVGYSWNTFLTGGLPPACRDRMARTFCLGTVAGVVVPFGIVLALMVWFDVQPTRTTWLMCLLLGIASIGVLGLFRSSRQSDAIAAGGVWLALLVAFVMGDPMQQVATHYSHRGLAKAADRQLTPHQQVVLVGDRSGSFVFYLSPSHRRTLRTAGRAFVGPTDALKPKHHVPGELVVPTPDALIECPELSTVIDGGYWSDTPGAVQQTVFLEEKDSQNEAARR